MGAEAASRPRCLLNPPSLVVVDDRARSDSFVVEFISQQKLEDLIVFPITIPNDRLRGLANKNAKMIDMFKRADEILLHSVKGITDLIMRPGLVNLDFADVKTTMSKAGMAIMGIGVANGENRAMDAAACIGCGACVAACPNASAMLFVSAKVSQLALLPQGRPEAAERAISMVKAMDDLLFGNCSNHRVCEAVCPKEISIINIARLNREFIKAGFASEAV